MSIKNRTQVDHITIQHAIEELKKKIDFRLHEKGKGTFASRHEILGIIEEEMHELNDAIKKDSLKEVKEELLDVAVAAVFGIACINNGSLDW